MPCRLELIGDERAAIVDHRQFRRRAPHIEGKQTIAAIKSFQESRDLRPNGVASDALYDELYKATGKTDNQMGHIYVRQDFNEVFDAPVKIGATMRYVMYHDVYGEEQNAKDLFGKLPAEAQRLSGVDFRAANAACPRGVDVAGQMERAARIFRA